jgi:hypothetical protein
MGSEQGTLRAKLNLKPGQRTEHQVPAAPLADRELPVQVSDFIPDLRASSLLNRRGLACAMCLAVVARLYAGRSRR